MNILFTGAGSGFGKTVYEKLIDQGHEVCGMGLNGPDKFVDFDSPEESMQLMNEALYDLLDRRKFPDVLVCNSGITRIDFLTDHKLEDFMSVLRVNLVAPFMLTKKWVQLREKHAIDSPGKVIYTSSMATSVALRASPGYCASKAGLESMMKVFAKEFAGKKPLTFMCIAPGGVDNTVMVEQVINDLMRTRGMTREEAERYNRQSPLGRNCTHDEVWKVFDFAVNNAPEYMSGSVIRMSGAFGV